jgi:hypothetical protein
MKNTFTSYSTLMLGMLLASSSLQADQSASSQHVDAVNLSFPGQAAVINIKNNSANKDVSKIKLAVEGSSMAFTLAGSVYCDPGLNVRFKGATAYFGPVNLNDDALNSSGTLHSQSVSVGYKEKNKDVVEYTEDVFTVPLNKVVNATPSLRVDALGEMEKKLQAHIQGGGKAVDFYQQDHDIVLQRPISLAGICGNNSKNTVGYYTKNHTVQIKYKGDPQIFQPAQVNAQLANAGLPNQVGNNLPFRLDQATFQANIPHYYGACLPNKNPKIRMNFQVSGSERGIIDLRVAAKSIYAYYQRDTFFTTEGMIRDPKSGGGHLDFEFPLKEILSVPQQSFMLQQNKIFSHNMRIEARYKNLQNGTWSPYKEYGTATFKHRCEPSVNPKLGNMGGMQGYQNKAPGPDNGSKPPRASAPTAVAPARDVTPPSPANPPRAVLPPQSSDPVVPTNKVAPATVPKPPRAVLPAQPVTPVVPANKVAPTVGPKPPRTLLTPPGGIKPLPAAQPPQEHQN